MRACVIGATGVVGSALTAQLLGNPAVSGVAAVTRRPLDVTHPKLNNTVIDFDAMEKVAQVFDCDALFLCLGTTRKLAGSIPAQRRVDLDYPLQAATLARNNSVDHCLLVSSPGAKADSLSPYLKMKGELEDRLQSLNFPRLSLFAPSLILGQRPDTRHAEQLGARLLPTLCRLPGLQRYRPISGDIIATAMINRALHPPASPVERITLDNIFTAAREIT